MPPVFVIRKINYLNFLFFIYFLFFLRKWKCPASLFCIFKKECFFFLLLLFFMLNSKNTSMSIHQDASIEETLRFHGWEIHIFLLYYLKHILLWKMTLLLWPAMTKILLPNDTFGTIFDSWWSGHFDVYPLFKRSLKEKGEQSWCRFPSFFW